jgi:Flp pilus assembly protein TadD
MAPDEVAAAIGHLCIEIGQIDKARPYVDAALQFNPNNARALVDKGDLYKHDKNYEAARARYEKAIALEPKNDWHHLDFGEYWLTVAGTQEDPDQRRYMLLQARQELFVADKLNEKNPETLAIYGESFLWKGEDPAKGIDTLELAHQLLPSNANIKFMLARAYVAVGRRDDARRLLNAMRAWSHEGGAEAAEKLLQEIDKRTADEPPAKGPRNQPTAPAQ